MLRIKPQTKRKIAGVVAFFLAAILVLSSVSVLFVNGAELSQTEAAQTEILAGGTLK